MRFKGFDSRVYGFLVWDIVYGALLGWGWRLKHRIRTANLFKAGPIARTPCMPKHLHPKMIESSK